MGTYCLWESICLHASGVEIAKHGSDLKKCSNKRTMTLVLHSSKILLRINMKMFCLKTRNEITKEHTGLGQGSKTREQLLNLRILIQMASEHQQTMCMCLVDFKMAFESRITKSRAQ